MRRSPILFPLHSHTPPSTIAMRRIPHPRRAAALWLCAALALASAQAQTPTAESDAEVPLFDLNSPPIDSESEAPAAELNSLTDQDAAAESTTEQEHPASAPQGKTTSEALLVLGVVLMVVGICMGIYKRRRR